MDNQLFVIEHGECAWPGLKAAPSILQFRGRARSKIHAPVFTFKQRSQRSSRVVLLPGLNAFHSPRPASVSTIKGAPFRASTSNKSAAVCSAAISTCCCSRIGPVSRPSSNSMVVLPVIVSPIATAH